MQRPSSTLTTHTILCTWFSSNQLYGNLYRFVAPACLRRAATEFHLTLLSSSCRRQKFNFHLPIATLCRSIRTLASQGYEH
eukprot:6018099-Amphidinium_carterae.1